MMGHLNSFSASGGVNLNKNFPKVQMPGGMPGWGMLKLRFDWYITHWQSDGSDLSAANVSWKVFTQAFASLLNEAEHGEPATDDGGTVGISSAPSKHKVFSLKFW